MKAKLGYCIDCDHPKETPLIARRCQFHYWKHRAEVNEAKRESKGIKKEVKKPKRIKQVSDKLLKLLAKYRKIRDKYLIEHPYCEVRDCQLRSSHVHHKAGREGDLLCDVKYFMAVCNFCHPRRIHETHVEWAKENGYIVTVVK